MSIMINLYYRSLESSDLRTHPSPRVHTVRIVTRPRSKAISSTSPLYVCLPFSESYALSACTCILPSSPCGLGANCSCIRRRYTPACTVSFTPTTVPCYTLAPSSVRAPLGARDSGRVLCVGVHLSTSRNSNGTWMDEKGYSGDITER